MSFSPQLPLNTKRGVVRRNQVVNTKWPHFIYCTVLMLPIAMHQGSHFNKVVNTKCPYFIYCTVFYCSISSCYLLQCTMRFIKTKNHFIATALHLFNFAAQETSVTVTVTLLHSKLKKQMHLPNCNRAEQYFIEL